MTWHCDGLVLAPTIVVTHLVQDRPLNSLPVALPARAQPVKEWLVEQVLRSHTDRVRAWHRHEHNPAPIRMFVIVTAFRKQDDLDSDLTMLQQWVRDAEPEEVEGVDPLSRSRRNSMI